MSAASKDKVARMKMLPLKQYNLCDKWCVMQALRSFMDMTAIHQILHESKKKGVPYEISALCTSSPVLSWLPHSCWVNFKFFKNNCTSLTDKTLQMYWDGSDEDKTRPQAFGNYNLK